MHIYFILGFINFSILWHIMGDLFLSIFMFLYKENGNINFLVCANTEEIQKFV